MSALLFVALGLGAVALIVALTIFLVIISSRQNWQFVQIPKGNTALVVKGKDLKINERLEIKK